MKKWGDIAAHRAGCPYKGVAVYGTDEEIAKHYSGICTGCNVPVKWQECERWEKGARTERSLGPAAVSRARRTS